jgi:hypothetical protein
LIKRLIMLGCSVASATLAQTGGGYLGPGVLSSGGGAGIGNRSGQQLDLRFYAGVNGFYDSSVQPTSIDSKGNLVTINGLYGAEGNIGLYGSHSWRRSQLGLDYHGVFRHYQGNSGADGIDQFLVLGYTLQESRRVSFNGQVLAGLLSNGISGVSILAPTPTLTSNEVALPSSLLFDSRSYFLQGGLDVKITQTPRTSFSLGGQGFEVWRQSKQLVGVDGWNARGTVEHKLNKTTSVGFTYQRQHFEFPRAFGQADIDTGEAFVGTNLGPRWQLVVRAGVFRSEVKGLQTVQLNPLVAALLGTTQAIQAFYREDYYPSGNISLSRSFKTSSLSFGFAQTVTPGNGVYLTSRTQAGTVGYSYTANRKLSLSAGGGYNALSSLGQGIAPYRGANGGGGMTYSLPWSLHAVARYDYRYQAIENFSYKHTGYAISLGLSYSPGHLPLSLW